MTPAPVAAAFDKTAQPAVPRPGSRQRPFPVGALVRIVGNLVEEHLGVVWVEGELSNLRRPASGHAYFLLKDAKSQLPGLMWRSSVERLALPLEEGRRFCVRGRLGMYPEQGRVQIYAEHAEPAGMGEAALALEALKRRLAAEGLFDADRKRALPRLPTSIGVVTSATGAAVRDIIRTIHRRFPVPIVLSPTRVQGEGAAHDVAMAIRRLCRQRIDVMIVGRGGGSSEDLFLFNDEQVVRAIAACTVPVVSAVGHEVDVTLADLVADVRAATPTAAGELVVPERAVCLEELSRTTLRLSREIRAVIAAARHGLERASHQLGHPGQVIGRERQKLDELLGRAAGHLRQTTVGGQREIAALERRLQLHHPRTELARQRAHLRDASARAETCVRHILETRQRALATAAAGLGALSPLGVLDRGYAIVRDHAGHVVMDPAETHDGDLLRIKVARGDITARVTDESDA